MEYTLEPVSCGGDYGAHKDSQQWFTEISSNLILTAAFSMSYFLEDVWIWIRILLIIGQALVSHVALQKCQIKAFIWALLFIFVNVYKLVKLGYQNRPTQLPAYLNVSGIIH